MEFGIKAYWEWTMNDLMLDIAEYLDEVGQ
jgi:hypothetical protein